MNPEINISGVILKTKRLTIRPWQEDDLADLYAYASVDGVGQMAGWRPHESIEQSRQILQGFIDGKKTFALEKDGRVIGSIGIERYNADRFPEFEKERCREIGFVLSKDFWGQGLMAEAVRRVIRYCFTEVSLDVLHCGYFDWNRQSARVQEKCGFRPYASYRLTTRLGTEELTRINILTRERWEEDETLSVLHSGELYLPGDEKIMQIQLGCLEKLALINRTLPSEMERRMAMIRDVFGAFGEGSYIEPPYHANFGGRHCFFGRNVYANFNLTCVDDSYITIGDSTMIGPNVTIATACHPMDPALRVQGYQYNRPVRIGKNCWIGSNAVILPGVTIGDNAVIGAGSVVTRDVPSDCVALGNPCRVR